MPNHLEAVYYIFPNEPFIVAFHISKQSIHQRPIEVLQLAFHKDVEVSYYVVSIEIDRTDDEWIDGPGRNDSKIDMPRAYVWVQCG